MRWVCGISPIVMMRRILDDGPPMQQAKEAMYALRANIWDHFGRDSDQGRTVFSDCVLFTDILFQEASPEWNLKKVYDGASLQDSISSLGGGDV